MLPGRVLRAGSHSNIVHPPFLLVWGAGAGADEVVFNECGCLCKVLLIIRADADEDNYEKKYANTSLIRMMVRGLV